jgi:hypothetical protein
VDLASLVSHPTTRVGDVVAEPAASVAVELADLDQAGQAELEERAGHVREVLTGYRRGSAEMALPGEPNPSTRWARR